MGTGQFSFHVKTAFKGIAKNSLMSLASTLSCACCLFLYGLFLLLTLNVNYLGQQVQNQCEIQAFYAPGTSYEVINITYEKIKTLPNVKAVEYESKEQALENYKAQLGEDAVAFEGLDGDNFMRDSLKIQMNDIAEVQTTVAQVSELDGIEEVLNRQDVVDKILHINRGIHIGSLIIIILLTLVSLLIIVNTISLSVHSRATEIHIMKYVGATNWFVRWPFIIEGLIVGALGGLLAGAAITVGYSYVLKRMENAFDIVKLCTLSDTALPLLSIFVFGVLMGGLGSLLAVRRHLDV